MRGSLTRIAVLALCLGAVAPARQAAAQVNFAIPESPAFTFLGLNPSVVSHPGTARDFMVSVTNGVDANGRVQQGLAFEISPWLYIPGASINLEAYRESFWKRLLANAQLSLGTARAAGDTGSTDVAFGLRLTILDESDPMKDWDFTAALATAMKGCAPKSPGESSLPCLDQVVSAESDKWFKQHWNDRRLSVGAAAGFRAVQSALQDRRWLGWSGWLSGGVGLGQWGQVLAQLQFDQRDSLQGAAETKSLTYGARVVAGSGGSNAFLELAGVHEFDAPAGSDAGSGRWSGGMEFRAGENLWISTGFGSRFSTLKQAEHVMLLAGIRWGFSKQARMDALRTEAQGWKSGT
ncbi:MAG TPA: hypothetical protein VMS93_05255 [Candidatus Saccharimonadales bacterium]|nr:hypothetical protein [Candidatus Saccharimonadales bacterium]